MARAVAGVLGLVLGGVLGERANLSTPIVVGVVGGLTSFIWLLASPLKRLRTLTPADM